MRLSEFITGKSLPPRDALHDVDNEAGEKETEDNEYVLPWDHPHIDLPSSLLVPSMRASEPISVETRREVLSEIAEIREIPPPVRSRLVPGRSLPDIYRRQC